jgi:ribosomal protein S12 methylthiotransferase accessory factor
LRDDGGASLPFLTANGRVRENRPTIQLSAETTDLWKAICSDDGVPCYRFGTRRAVPPAVTLRRILPCLGAMGITRLADVTGLDWVGLPVYQAIRPNSRNISVSQGKGLTRDQAKVSALMESIESFHAEEIRSPGRWATVGETRSELNYDPHALATVQTSVGATRDPHYDPYAPPIGKPSLLSDTTPVEWIEATDLCTGASTWAPRQLCELNFELAERLSVPLFRASSNGLASGNTHAEAVVHGLCEVIERDAMWRGASARFDADRHVDPQSIGSAIAQRIVDRFRRAGLNTSIVQLSGPTGVPCFEAFLEHPDSAGRHYGAGCHPSRLTALLRALTEAAQSRLGHIAGSRDDLYRRTYQFRPALSDEEEQASFPFEARARFTHSPNLHVPRFGSMVQEVARRVQQVTGMPPLAVDLTRPEFGIPVVSVLAPGLRLRPPSRQ